VLIIGAGPAGLATAYSLSVKHGIKCIIFEKSPNIGGLCETVEHNGYHMDHSIETGFLAARVVMGEKLNVWAVNEDAEYHEEH